MHRVEMHGLWQGESSMSVMVYSRLGDLLRTRNLTVGDLQHQIAARFGWTVDARTLNRLARAERVRGPNIEIVAAVLGVRLDDVLRVDAIPLGDAGGSLTTKPSIKNGRANEAPEHKARAR